MIDIENELYTHIKSLLPSSVTFAAEFVRTPSSFPFVSMQVRDNTLYNPDSSGLENYCRIMIQFDVYSNKNSGRKQECKSIISTIDTAMNALGFSRISLSPTPNLEDSTIFRLTARYTGVVDINKTIWR